MILDGKECSQKILSEISEKVKTMPKAPRLGILLVGDDESSMIYVRNKEKAAISVGFSCVIERVSSDISENALLDIIVRFNADPSIDGYILQLPLPAHLNMEKVIAAIDPKKDVDGLHPFHQGSLLRGAPTRLPATPRGILELLSRSHISVEGKRVVVVGRSTIVGRPLAAAFLLKGERGNATVTVAHSHTKNLKEICREADILVVAIGKGHLITAEYVKSGAVVIDVGINRIIGLEGPKVCGDVDFESVKEVASAISPVPGGVGPMTVAMLLLNTLEAAEQR